MFCVFVGFYEWGAYFCWRRICCCRLRDLSLRERSACVTGYAAPVKWWGKTHKGAQIEGITAAGTASHVAAANVPIHKVFSKRSTRLQWHLYSGNVTHSGVFYPLLSFYFGRLEWALWSVTPQRVVSSRGANDLQETFPPPDDWKRELEAMRPLREAVPSGSANSPSMKVASCRSEFALSTQENMCFANTYRPCYVCWTRCCWTWCLLCWSLWPRLIL